MKRISKQVMAGNVKIGGGAPVTVQSMLNVPSTDIEGSVRQAVALEKAGCQILRAAIPDMDAVRLIPAIKEKISIPLVADIHFDYKLALEAAAAGSYDEKNGTHCYDSQSNQHSQRGCKYRFEELFHNVLCNCCSFFK